MKHTYILLRVFSFLACSILFSFCKGQEEKNSAAEWAFKKEGSATLIKTQGTSVYDNVHCGIEDKDGNLWFGTTGEGLYRFDGKTFTQFTKSDGLLSNKVWSIFQDRAGIIWIGTNAGICKFDGKTFSEVSITKSKNLALQSSNTTEPPFWSIFQDKSGKIWFGTNEGLYYYQNNHFVQLSYDLNILNKQSLRLTDVQCIFEDQAGILWFGSGPMAGECIVRFDGKTLEQFKPKNETWIRAISQSQNGDLLFSTRRFGLCKYDGNAFTFEPSSTAVKKESLMSCFEDSKGNFWYGSDYGTMPNDSIGGLWRSDGKIVRRFTKEDGLSNTDVYFLLEDKEGKIWIGTRNVSLFCYDGKKILNYNAN
jgi:ligand-binding sensor domain-containing protein